VTEVGSFEARNKLSGLLDRAEHGEDIVITRRGKPVAKLVPFQNAPGTEQARLAAQRIRDLAEVMNLGRFVWDEWKGYRDEGRP
jgi:prevent-host-death family protein